MSVWLSYVLTTLATIFIFAVLDGIFSKGVSPEAALIVGLGLTWAMNEDKKRKTQYKIESDND